jgi:hypothetical protein
VRNKVASRPLTDGITFFMTPNIAVDQGFQTHF